MKVVCLVNSAAKSWAVGLEIINQFYLSKNEKVDILVLDVSRWESIKFPSKSRRKFQANFCSSRGVAEKVLRVFGSFGLRSFLYAAIVTLTKKIKLLDSLASYESLRQVIELCIKQELGGEEVDVKLAPRRLLFRTVRKGLLAFLYCKKHVSSPIMLIVYNGRGIVESTWIRRVLDFDGTIRIAERGSSHSKFEVYDVSPHYNPEWWEKIIRINEEKKEVGAHSRTVEDYMQKRIAGYDSFEDVRWKSVSTTPLVLKNLPDKFISYFATSGHEFSPIKEFNQQPGFSSQREAVLTLLAEARILKIPVVIRRHPNSCSMFDNQDRERVFWQSLSNEDVLIFHPESQIDSLAIAKQSKLVFVWKSSIGVETLHLGIPTYALGAARWAFLPEVRAWSADKIQSVIREPILKHASKIVSSYAYYMSTAGKEMKLFDSCDGQKAITAEKVVIFSSKHLDTFFKLKSLRNRQKVKGFQHGSS